MEEWVRLTAFAYRNLIMARRNVFFLFELTFWPGVAMLSHGLLTRFLDLTPEMTAFILVGTVALSAVQVCQLDVAYAVLFDIWSKSMKHQFLTPIGIRHMAVGSWVVGVLVCSLVVLFGTRAETSAWAAVNFVVMLSGIYYPVSVLPDWVQVISAAVPLTYFLDAFRAGYGFEPHYAHAWFWGFALTGLYVVLA